MAILKKVTGDAAAQIIELKGDSIVIGRAPECNIILDPNGVSRRHAEIRRQGDRFVVDDLQSRNKTRVNDAFLVPGQAHILREGDRINICDVEFIYHHTAPTITEVEPARPPAGEEMVVTEGFGDSLFHTLDASRSDMASCSVRPEAKLHAILQISRNLTTELNIDTVAPKILDSLFELFPQVERGFLVLVDQKTQRLIRKAFKYRQNRPALGRRPPFGSAPQYDDEVPMSISRSIVNHVLGQKKAILSEDAGADSNLPTSASIADLKIRSIMCVPLLTRDGTALGILQLDTSDRKRFSQDDLELLLVVAGQASTAIENAAMHESLLARERLDRDLRLAQQVQRVFLPPVPKVPGFEFFAHYDPAYEVGGDYYDFVKLPGNRQAIALGDVSGKGVTAALMMAKFHGDTRYCILTEDQPAAAANRLNEMFCAAGIEEKFITLSLGVLDLERRELTLCSAGHLPVLVRRRDGTVEEVGEEIGGFPLGVMPESNYQQVRLTLEPGEVVVVYSDGVPDARNRDEELYDSKENKRLRQRVATAAGGPEAVGRAILQEVREYSAGHRQVDDITLVCFGPNSGG